MKKAFSLIELSIVILIIGILIAGVTQGSIMVAKSRLASAAKMTESSPVNSIKDLVAWFETTSDGSFKTTQAEDGQPIDTWYDINQAAGSKNNATQASSARQPTYIESSINNLPVVRFQQVISATDPDGDYLAADSIASIAPSPMTVFIVMKPTFTASVATLKAAFSFHLGTTNSLIVGFASGSDFAEVSGTTDFDIGYASNLYNKPSIYSYKFYGPTNLTMDLYINGTSYTPTPVNSSQILAANRFSIGQEWDTNPSDFMSGDIAEFIIYGRALNNTERREVEAYLSKKWGIKVS